MTVTIRRVSRCVVPDGANAAMRDPMEGTYYYAPPGATHEDVLVSLKDKFPDRVFDGWEKGWVDKRLNFKTGEPEFVQPIL